MSVSRGLAWTRLIAIRAALVGMQGTIDELRVQLKEAENVARQAGQAWSSLSDEMVNGEKPRNADELEARYTKMEKARRELKRREADKNSVKVEVDYHERESKRLRTQFDTIFDEAAKGEGLFDQGKPPADQVRTVELADIIPPDARESLEAAGVRSVGDFIDTVKRRGGVSNLGLADTSLRAACEAVAASIRAAGDGDLPPVLREYSGVREPESTPAEAGEGDSGAGEGQAQDPPAAAASPVHVVGRRRAAEKPKPSKGKHAKAAKPGAKSGGKSARKR